MATGSGGAYSTGGAADKCAVEEKTPTADFGACWAGDSSFASNVLVVDLNSANTLVWPGGNQSASNWMSVGFINFNNGDGGNNALDPADISPATVHIFFEQRNDNLVNPNGRWWADPSVYDLGSRDNETITTVVPFDAAQWSNVDDGSDPESFYAALRNVGWIGVTCGGQYFWGHGVALTSGAAGYILVDLQVE